MWIETLAKLIQLLDAFVWSHRVFETPCAASARSRNGLSEMRMSAKSRTARSVISRRYERCHTKYRVFVWHAMNTRKLCGNCSFT